MTSRRRRTLTSDEVALWAHVTRHIAPIQPRNPSPPPPEAPALPAGDPAPASAAKAPPGKFRKPAWKKPAVSSPPGAASPPPSPAQPPLAPLERRLRQRLSRGSHPIDAVIDLHGLRQDEAHGALRGFLRSAQSQGHKVVLVVTGKGSAGVTGSLFEERGVLRRSVPHWLRMADLRSIVVGFEEAEQHHGGGGALYVRIRRARGPGS
ncbi:MAG: Smr/MutS family protein [Alsobacter sp.]